MMILQTYLIYPLMKCVSFLNEISIWHHAWRIDYQYVTRNNMKYIQSKILDAELVSDSYKVWDSVEPAVLDVINK